jgi:hypothetical protein
MDMARVRDLIEALLESQPILAEDSTFLRRALVVGGVNSLISPVHLESFFTRYGAVMATVLLRDAARGERIGMLVFFAESDCLEAAESEAARPGAYRTISRVQTPLLCFSSPIRSCRSISWVRDIGRSGVLGAILA